MGDPENIVSPSGYARSGAEPWPKYLEHFVSHRTDLVVGEEEEKEEENFAKQKYSIKNNTIKISPHLLSVHYGAF